MTCGVVGEGWVTGLGPQGFPPGLFSSYVQGLTTRLNLHSSLRSTHAWFPLPLPPLNLLTSPHSLPSIYPFVMSLSDSSDTVYLLHQIGSCTGRNSSLSCSLLCPQHLAQGLAHSRCSISICCLKESMDSSSLQIIKMV